MTSTRPLFAAAALLAGLAPAMGAHAADPLARFVQLPSDSEFAPALQPLAGRVTIVLKLAGDPVAVVRSRAPGKEISEGEQRSIEDQLRRDQDALHPLIEASGGTVLAKFQNAINGIKVQVPVEKLAAVTTLPGVVGVKPVAVYKLDNAVSVPFIGAPAVWGANPGFRGEHVRVAILDTGIDFTHANFAGPGTVAAFNAAFAASTSPANPALFGPNAPKVKGGTDLVGDDYNASSDDPKLNTPKPDPNPLDCNGHGSHVAGTAAGFGVRATGSTFTGPYNGATPSTAFRIGPGVAPLADLYAVRVFGCTGSTNVVVDALDWAVKNHMQVVNMSLGSSFGLVDDASAEASTNAVEAGVVVVASAGNSGPNPYITGSPASGEKAISVAAVDSTASFPGAALKLSATSTVNAINANGATFTDGTTLPIVVLRTGGAISLGCNPAEYTAAGVTGKLVVTARGTCARVARAVFGQKAGAAAVLMVNNAAGFPPFEGKITGNPDTGEVFDVTIPFLGVPPETAAAVAAAASATLTNTTIANPGFRRFASFSSGGPRNGDGHLKPDISAPGVSIVSTGIGTGNGAATISGTSMAAPHVAGVAALAVQSHPGWDAEDIRAAIVNTSEPAQQLGFSARVGGSGLAQPFGATRTSVIATARRGATNLSFGVEQFSRNFSEEAEIEVRNLGSTTATFAVTVIPGVGSPHTLTVRPSTVTVRGGRHEKIQVNLSIPAATAGNANAFRQVSGQIALSPTTATGNRGTSLTVPYFVVPRARSQVDAELRSAFGPANPSTTVRLENDSRAVAGTADFYAWGLSGKSAKLGSNGLRAVGVQSFPLTLQLTNPPGTVETRFLVFAVNTFAAFSTAATKEVDILIDVDRDGKPEFALIAFDFGALTTGSFSGDVASALINLRTGATRIRFLAFAPTDGSTIELPVRASDIADAKCSRTGGPCAINAATPSFNYNAQLFDLDSAASDAIAATASFNAFNPSISTGAFVDLAAGGTASVALTLNPAEFAKTPALGAMVVSTDNFSGKKQANLLRIGGEQDDD